MTDPSFKPGGRDALIREATPQEIEAWDELVARFDGCRVFHKTVWLRYVESFSGARAVRLVFERGDEIVGCLPGFLLRKGLLLRVFASPLVGWQTESMGPLFDAGRVSAREICAALLPFLKARYGVHHVELTSARLDRDAMTGLGFRGRQSSTYRVPLFPGDAERAFKNIKAKTRNQLRKAIKLGLVARAETDESFVAEFYDQVREVFTRRGKSVPFNEDRVLKCFRHLKNAGNLLAISVSLPGGGKCIATGLFMREGRELHLWGWAHRTEFRWHCPVELLTWTAMQRGMEAGCTTLDMAGGGDAKLKFGALADATLCEWTWSRYAWLARARDLAERAYRRQQSARGRFARRRARGGRATAHATTDAPPRTTRAAYADELTAHES
ncbi:MAG TPA: GNAT family N-acetyltransferase [Pyrinomonadaceae bacterium]|jgi:CelD/BcsL family acetyltransferase involved in cellulose biosynthesis|nr:GNAT family N-acetyltransferase [Pyrinomonadaceae bacterium]